MTLLLMRQMYRQASCRLLLLDYDGTLVGFQPRPELAAPTTRVMETLRRLSSDPANTVVVISGRSTETLEKWLGALPITLIAEHGSYTKLPAQGWEQAAVFADEWKGDVRCILQQSVQTVQGSFIEEKSTALVWHYRQADVQAASVEAAALVERLSGLAGQFQLQITPGNHIVEIRVTGVDKGQAAAHLLHQRAWDFVLAAGDDTTDEDMFAVLPPSAYSIKVGSGDTSAKERVQSPALLLDLLESLSI